MRIAVRPAGHGTPGGRLATAPQAGPEPSAAQDSAPERPPAQEVPADSPPPSDQPPRDPRPVRRELLPFDPRQEVSITRTWDQPVLESRKLGGIPDDYYEFAWSYPVPGWGWWPTTERRYGCHSDACEMGPVPILRDVPVYDEKGAPVKESVTRTLTEKTYDQKMTFFTGGGAGLGLGAAAGAGLAAALGGGGVVAAAVIGGALGAVAGGTIGYKAVDDDRIEEVWMQESILHPTMTGYVERVTPDVWHETRCRDVDNGNGTTRQECETWARLRGYDHDFYPDINWRAVGDYTYPTLQHTARFSPVGSGFLAAGAGAGLGALAALAVRYLPALL